MGKRRTIFSIFILSVCLLLTSCVLFRVIKVRNQLKNFDENFEIRDADGLELVFKNPVLSANDMVWIMRSHPTAVIKDDNYDLWTYHFVKRYAGKKNEKGNFDFDLKMRFYGNKLHSIIFPKRFLLYVSKSVFSKFMSSMGETKIKKLKKSATSEIDSLRDEELPTTKDIIIILGKPYVSQKLEHSKVYKYKYKTVISKEEGRSLRLKFFLYFDLETDRLSRLHTGIRGNDIKIDFKNFN